MTASCSSPYSNDQMTAWIRGLLAIAWADGHFDPEEQTLIADLTHSDLALEGDPEALTPIAPEDLARTLGEDPKIRENFLRTAVMMALANGVYSTAEADMVHRFQEALGLSVEALAALEKTLYDPQTPPTDDHSHPPSDVLHPVRDWLDHLEIHDPKLARLLCKAIPSQCPFERDIVLFGRKIVHIPPMCKLNPLYEQLVGLRFRSLSYLADECGEDVTPYI